MVIRCWFYLYHSVAACKLSICNFLCIYRLIIGGIPAILRSLKDGWQSEEKKSLLVNILVFLILLAVAMAMVFLNGDSESGIALTASAV